MRKRLFLYLGLIISMPGIFAQDITNSGFENWEMNTYFEEPDQYRTTNLQSYLSDYGPNVIKSTESHGGNYALELISIPFEDDVLPGVAYIGDLGDEMVYGGIPYTERPDSVAGYAKFIIQPTDTAKLFLIFKKAGKPLGLSIVPFAGESPEYGRFSQEIQWFFPVLTPDTLALALSSGNIMGEMLPGSQISFDDVSLIGATQPFPNGDFENWNVFEAEDPTGWLTSNAFILDDNPGVTKSMDSYSGNYAVRMENKELIMEDTIGFITNGKLGEDGPVGGMKVDATPEKISGYYKFDPQGPDTALAKVTLFWYDDVIDSTIVLEEKYKRLPETDDYTLFEVEIDYDGWPIPDTVNIAFASGNFEYDTAYTGLGSILFIDELSITYKPVAIEESETDQLSVFPNPVKSNLYLSRTFNQTVGASIYNRVGELVFEAELLTDQNNLDLHNLPPGFYLLRIELPDQPINTFFIKN